MNKNYFIILLFYNYIIDFYIFAQKYKKIMDFTLNKEDALYKKVESFDSEATKKLMYHYREVLKIIGENPEREGLIKTPLRVAKAMQFMNQGYDMDPVQILESAKFQENYKQMVLVKDIEIYSLCEHHMLPFFGKAHVAYIPNKYITGLSKIARVVDVFSRRLQVQERLTTQIKDCINDVLEPLGVAVIIEAQHLCMQMRGVQKQNSITTTSDFTGVFKTDPTRSEFIRLVEMNR